MALSYKFKFLFALKINFSGGQFNKEISKFDYFEKWEKVIKVVKVEHWRRKFNLKKIVKKVWCRMQA